MASRNPGTGYFLLPCQVSLGLSWLEPPHSLLHGRHLCKHSGWHLSHPRKTNRHFVFMVAHQGLAGQNWSSRTPQPGPGIHMCVCAQSSLTLCDPMDCSPPGSSVHGILQARIVEWLPCPPPGIFPTQGSNSGLLCLLHWQAGYLLLAPLGKPIDKNKLY